jgi:hypothetical protein
VDGFAYSTADTYMVRELGEGAHNWSVRSVDEWANASDYATERTVTVDTTPPAVPTLSSPENNSYTTSSDVTFSWSDVSAFSYDLRVDGLVYSTDDTSMTRGLTDGAHTWTVRALDELGNASVYASEWTVNVDTTAPPIPDLVHPANGTATRQAQVQFVWENVGADAYNLRVGGDVYTATSGSTSMTLVLADGVYNWSVRSVDWLGNASAYASEWMVTVDTTPPPVPALQSPSDDAYTNQPNVEFRWETAEAPTYNLRVDGGVYTTTTTSMILELGEGAHQWTVRSIDWLGNASAYAGEWTVNVDTTPPPSPSLLAPADGTVTRNVNINFSWQNVGAHAYDLSVDGEVYAVTGGATSKTLTLDEGAQSWTVRSRDWLGNASEYAAPWTLTIDITPPPKPALLIPADGTATRNPDVQFGWSDVGASTYNLMVDGVVYPTSDTSMTRRLGEGTHSWTVEAVDAVGNKSGYADAWQVTVDTVPPLKPTLLSPANGVYTTTAGIRFSWTSTTGAVLYNLQVDESVYTTTATSAPRVLSDGAHTWAVQAQDWLGNASGYTDQRTLTVDTAIPLATISAPTNGAVLTTTHLYTVTIRGTASDVGTGLERVEAKIGGAEWNRVTGTSNWTYPWALPQVDNVPVALKVRSFDRAGNESVWAQIGVNVDTIAPDCSAPVPNRSPWVTSTVIYTWPAASDGSGITLYQIHIYSTGEPGYDAVFDTTDSRFVFAQATRESESYYAQVRAQDGSGNWGPWSAPSVDVIPDLTPPTTSDPFISETSPYLHAVGTQLYYTNTMPSWLGQPFTVLGFAEDRPSGVNRVCFSAAFGDQPSCDTSGFQPWQSGSPNYEVDSGTASTGAIVATVHDRAGNTVQQSFGYELDETPPNSRASSQPYATSSPIRVAWTATDAQSGVYLLDLWYKYGSGGAWTYWSTQPATEGSFEFELRDGPGTYCFVTVARDNLGNLEPRATDADACTLYDTDAPTSEVTWAPEYWNELGMPITMTWVATPSLAALSEVRLWYRFDGDEGVWTSTSVVSTGSATSGEFSFDLPIGNGDGRYDFATVARDISAKSEADPYNSGDRTTWYDTAIDSPSGLACNPAGWSQDNSFVVRWENPEDLSGIAAAYYRVGTAPQYLRDGTRVPGADLTQIGGVTLPAEGLHTVWIWLEDRAGNIDHTGAQPTSCKYDATVEAPGDLASVPSGWTATNVFSVTWSNPPSEQSGIAGAYWKIDSAPVGPDDGARVSGPDLERIANLSVSGEGSHTLYLWLFDLAGNIGFDNRQTVNLQFDPSAPTGVSISAPEIASSISFAVHWSADAAESGVLRYTVEYSGAMDSEWQPWLPATTETSGMFRAPVADAGYHFRVTVHDNAGNSAWAQAETYVEPQRAYLPMLRDQWRDWYRYDLYEPNDKPTEAYGPLKSDQTYWAYIWSEEDLNDYYYFVPTSASQVRIYLSDIPPSRDYDLYVYYYAGGKYILDQYSNRPGSVSEELFFVPVPGRKYYVRIYPLAGHSNQQRYSLKVTYQ